MEVVVGLPGAPRRRRGARGRRHSRRTPTRLATAVAPVPVAWRTRGCRPWSQPVGWPNVASEGSVNGRSSTRRPRWRSCRAGWMRSGGRRDDRRAGPGVRRAAERGRPRHRRGARGPRRQADAARQVRRRVPDGVRPARPCSAAASASASTRSRASSPRPTTTAPAPARCRSRSSRTPRSPTSATPWSRPTWSRAPRRSSRRPTTNPQQQEHPAGHVQAAQADARRGRAGAAARPEGTGGQRGHHPRGQDRRAGLRRCSPRPPNIPVDDFEAAAKDPGRWACPDFWFNRTRRQEGRPSRSRASCSRPRTSSTPNATADADPRRTMVDAVHRRSTEDIDFVDHGAEEAARSRPYEALIVASLAQAEAGNADGPRQDRPGRLQPGRTAATSHACLQFDVDDQLLAASSGQADEASGQLTKAELDDPKNPYNTHDKAGLPPAPINNPGEAALKGAMDPPAGPWLLLRGHRQGGPLGVRHDRRRAPAHERGAGRQERRSADV